MMTALRLLLALLAAAAAGSPYLGIVPAWTPSLATIAALNAVALVGLNLIFGVTGMLAFGQAAFVALPGYIAGILGGLGVPLAAAVAAGFLGAVLVARLVAGIFVRLPGIFFAVGTLGFAFVVEGVARAFPAWTGGASGLVFDAGRGLSGDTWYLVSLGALAVSLAIYGRLARGALFRTLRMIRHDELAAATMGIDVARMKTIVFTLGSAFSAAAGLLTAYYVGVLVPESAGANRSLEQVGMLLLGGLGTLLGPPVGSAVVNWLLSVSGYGARFELLIYGVAFLATVLYAREGVMGLLARPWRRLTTPLNAPLLAALPVAAMPSGSCEIRPVHEPCLAVSQVSKRFGGVQALDGVSFAVRPGELYMLVGPNGAGKTTLFNIISGIERPTAGTVELDGRDIAGEAIHRRASRIGRSFQVARLIPELTATENVMVRLDRIQPELAEAERRAAARAQLDGFGLGALADRPVRELGIGQHKLIDLARAAIGNPPLVLLDEPAVGLTPTELDHLEDLLLQLKKQACAVVIVEHNIEFVARVAERGVVLDGGRIIAEGTTERILADPAVRQAYFGALA
jgi:ABC-type branched-subunit amino acid transport system ATPase component/ABC-type branched-subunit amino acid transport system permease subunit